MTAKDTAERARRVAGEAERLAVVTGVTSGIGLALTERLLRDGYAVIGIARSEGKLADVAPRFGEAGRRFAPWTVDLQEASSRAEALERLAALTGPVRLLVNNAAACAYETPLRYPAAAWRALVETNLLGALDVVKAFDARLERGAHVVNLSSVTARFLPHERFAPYAVTKAALDQLTEAIRMELRERGVKVTSVAPGLVDTPIYDKVEGFDGAKRRLTEQIPRWLAPEDVADTIAWLVSRPAHVVVGEITLFPAGQTR